MKVTKMLRTSRFLLAGVVTVLGWLMAGCGGEDSRAAPAMALFAGDVSMASGSADGTGTEARFSDPRYVAIDSAGNVYVADKGNGTIRKVTPAGVVTTLAGAAGEFGYVNDTGAAARFDSPRGMATDSEGNVYVADASNHAIRKITPAGVVTTFAGSATGEVGATDAPTGTDARFNWPNGLASDGSKLYVADSDNHVIRQIDLATTAVTTLAGTAGEVGFVNAIGAEARFDSPRGVATDNAGNVYVADTNHHVIRQIDPDGVVTTLAGSPTAERGQTDAIGTAATFDYPTGLASDGSKLYVADGDNNAIRQIDIATQAVTTLAGDTAGGAGYVDAVGTSARFDWPYGVATDSAGHVYVADSDNNTIRKIDINTQAVTTLAGFAGHGYVNATGAAARFDLPNGIATDSAGNVYVADTDNNAIRKITPAGVVSTFAGSATGLAGHTDGPGTTALFDGPWGVATDSSDNVYVADYRNDAIRKITPDGVVRTLVDSDTGVAAVFDGPDDVAVDSHGNVYVAAYGGDTIGKITPDGVVSTLAGTGTAGYTNGPGVSAQFNGPWSIATDSAGNVYVSDYFNNAIRKIDTSGRVSTFAGSPTGRAGSTDGTGTKARFAMPGYVTTDSADNVYVTDTGNNTIRKITAGGVVTTLAGTAGQNGFTPGALPGALSNPAGIRVFGTTLYFVSNNGLVAITHLP